MQGSQARSRPSSCLADYCLAGKRQVTAGVHRECRKGPPPGCVLATGPQVQVLGAAKHSGSSGGICSPSPWEPLGPSLPVTPSASWAPALWSPGDGMAMGPGWGQPATGGRSWLQGVPGWAQVLAAGEDALTQAQEAAAAPLLPRPGRPHGQLHPQSLRGSRCGGPWEGPPCSLPPLLGSSHTGHPTDRAGPVIPTRAQSRGTQGVPQGSASPPAGKVVF